MLWCGISFGVLFDIVRLVVVDCVDLFIVLFRYV